MHWMRRTCCNLLIGLALGVSGCVMDNTVRIRSVERNVEDSPVLPIGAYLAESESAATVYLTDLDAAALDRGSDLSRISGRIVQIRLFLNPSPGSTPVVTTACSATVRHIILANGSIGVYGGGGFLDPSGRIGDVRISGSLRGTTARLTGSAGAFSDRLGASNLDAHFSVRRDDALAKRIGARVDDILLAVGEKRGS